VGTHSGISHVLLAFSSLLGSPPPQTISYKRVVNYLPSRSGSSILPPPFPPLLSSSLSLSPWRRHEQGERRRLIRKKNQRRSPSRSPPPSPPPRLLAPCRLKEIPFSRMVSRHDVGAGCEFIGNPQDLPTSSERKQPPLRPSSGRPDFSSACGAAGEGGGGGRARRRALRDHSRSFESSGRRNWNGHKCMFIAPARKIV